MISMNKSFILVLIILLVVVPISLYFLIDLFTAEFVFVLSTIAIVVLKLTLKNVKIKSKEIQEFLFGGIVIFGVWSAFDMANFLGYFFMMCFFAVALVSYSAYLWIRDRKKKKHLPEGYKPQAERYSYLFNVISEDAKKQLKDIENKVKKVAK